jgi:hypothetical protein
VGDLNADGLAARLARHHGARVDVPERDAVLVARLLALEHLPGLRVTTGHGGRVDEGQTQPGLVDGDGTHGALLESEDPQKGEQVPARTGARVGSKCIATPRGPVPRARGVRAPPGPS